MTRIGISGTQWLIDGSITYPTAAAEGLLMNVRMVNSTFEDRHRTDFDCDANTRSFLDQVPDYAENGIRAFTLCLQGGMPGYEGALNSGFEPDGSLRVDYLERVERVIRGCDEHGVAIILSCFYQRQDQVLTDADAVRSGVVNVVRWIKDCEFTNVVLEIANEHAHRGFTHDIIRRPAGQVELIGLAKETSSGLIVSTSGMGGGRAAAEIAEMADFIIIHFNNTPMEEVPDRVEAFRHIGKPIVCNEDTKVGAQGAEVAALCVRIGCSWGLMSMAVNQYYPFEFNGADDDPETYSRLKELTSPS